MSGDDGVMVAAMATAEDVSSVFVPAILHELDEIIVREVIGCGKGKAISGTTAMVSTPLHQNAFSKHSSPPNRRDRHGSGDLQVYHRGA
ncbi:hypothetical protein [Rhizobium jaguaris]|uniref:hypothetical protein n=1 Tax=Rhizobium jaguaris TaxID=1312183 RepID=UPI0013C419CE|nr:hypothetical protein [Rhizobium jaguaris]